MPELPGPAVVLLSGGIDSATAAAMARADGFTLHAMTVFYGQRHAIEVEAARKVAAHLMIRHHKEVRIDLGEIGGSALTDPEIKVPKPQTLEKMNEAIPPTYVPARNTVLLALALGYAEVLGARSIFTGVNQVDYSGYPDCRPEFIQAFERVANLGTKAGIEGARFHIHTPLINMTKAEIIRTGLDLGLDYSLTHSCYDPSPKGLACGECDSCILRRKGFEEAGVPDPTRYVNG